MLDESQLGLTELAAADLMETSGGYLALAIFFVGCFGAGFRFGYNELGPSLES